MAFFEWNDQYSVGVANVDEQHKKLVGYLNDLFEALNVGKGKEILDSILDNMVEYTQYHFATEEKLMKLHGYPGYDDHKKKHDKLAEHVLDLKSQYAAGNIVKVSPIQIGIFLKDWLSKHIMGTDKLFGPFLNSKGVQ